MKTWKYLWLLLIVALLVPLNVSAKKKTEKVKSDRELWAGILYQMAAPVLSNMSEGKLQENMLVELSPTWDGRDKRVTYMECFGRLMAGLAPWLSLPDDDTAEGKQRKQLREWALKSYAQSVDPESKDYLLWRKEGQPLVDAAYIAESFLRGYDALWVVPLSATTDNLYFPDLQIEHSSLMPIHAIVCVVFLLPYHHRAVTATEPVRPSTVRSIPYKSPAYHDRPM